jgi:Zn-dependent protease/CBS domain-containing protein
VSGRVKLGRIWSVPIRGTYSLAGLALLLSGMAVWQFSTILPGQSRLAYALAALGSAVLFLWTVFAHEAAHLIAAREYGAKVNGVTLSFYGGETAISGQPASPRQGAVVAMAGPVTSIGCGFICGAAAIAVARLDLPGLVVLSLLWAGALSILVGLANLIPVAPLDGGHVLQAAVWWGTGNRVRASAVAGFAGQIVGLAIVLCAAWLAIFQFSLIAAILTVVVAWPIWRGASATRRAAQQRAHLGGMTIGELVAAEARTVRDDVTAAAVAAQFADRSDGYVAVVDKDGRPRGVLSMEQVRKVASAHPARAIGRLLLRRSPVTATANEPLADVLERTYAKPRPVVLVEGDTAAALIEPTDIRAALAGPSTVDADVEPADVWPGATSAA